MNIRNPEIGVQMYENNFMQLDNKNVKNVKINV
jgi:hypothetical protein